MRIPFLGHKSSSTTTAAIVLGVASLLSKIFGLLRDRLLASHFGAGAQLDIYYTAFRIPDFIFDILILGAVTSAFIPIFSDIFLKDKKKAFDFSSNFLNIFFVGIVVVSGLLVVFAPFVVRLIAPGFSADFQAQTVTLSRIMFLSPIFLSLSNILGSLLQYFSRFLVYSLAPIFYNLGIIVGIVYFVPIYGFKGLAFGVVLGAILHFLIQLVAIGETGFKWKPIFNLKDVHIKKVFELMIPRSLGLAGQDISIMLMNALASTLIVGSIAAINLANNIQYILIGVFGISFATAAFPDLARLFSKSDKPAFLSKFTSVFSQTIFIVMPLSILFFILRAQIVRVLYGTGVFGWSDTRITAATLGAMSLGIIFQSLIPLLSRAFYATKNTRTPVTINTFFAFFSVGFAWALVGIFNKFPILTQKIAEFFRIEDLQQYVSILSMPIATDIAVFLQVTLLVWALERHIGNSWIKKIVKIFLEVLLISIASGVVCYVFLNVLSFVFDLTTAVGVFSQGFFAGLASLIFYMILAKILKLEELKYFKFGIWRRKKIQN